MRPLTAAIVLVFSCISAMAQENSKAESEELTGRARSLYDAPFTRGLISFDCEVQFDWNKHFNDLFGSVPPNAHSLVYRVKTVSHRVLVDRTRATLTSLASQAKLEDVAHAAELEQGFIAIATSGLNAWLPASTNVLLPVTPTKSMWETTGAGYKLKMTGPGVDGQLLLSEDLRLTSGVTTLPQPMRFSTEFKSDPNGFLLKSVKTGSTSDPSAASEASFAYTYQPVQGFQIPLQITVIAATAETWQYSLRDCRISKGIVIHAVPVH